VVPPQLRDVCDLLSHCCFSGLRCAIGLSPLEVQGDIPRQTVGPSYDCCRHLEAMGPQLLFEVVVSFLGVAGERLWPIGVTIVDASAAIGAKSAWERHNLELLKPSLGCNANGVV